MSTPDAIDSELESVHRHLAELNDTLVPLVAQHGRLHRRREELESLQFIRDHKIRREDVEFSSGAGFWFTSALEFAAWLNTNKSRKRWVEWNGRLYDARLFKARRFETTPGMTAHLPANEVAK